MARWHPKNWPPQAPAVLVAAVFVAGSMVWLTLKEGEERRERQAQQARQAALSRFTPAPPPARPPASGAVPAEATPLAAAEARMERVSWPAPLDAAALAVAYQRAGDRDAAARWLQVAERSIRRHSSPARFGDWALLSCAAGELGDEAKRGTLLKEAAAGGLSSKEESSLYLRAIRACLELELAAFTTPLLDAAFVAASKLDDPETLIALARLQVLAGNRAGLAQAIEHVVDKHGLDDVRRRRAHAELAVHAAQLGDKTRARRLLQPLLKSNDDAYTMSLVLHALAALGDAAQVRKRLPAVLERLRAGGTDASVQMVRRRLAIASAMVGDLERARGLATDWPEVLAEAGRWDELLPLRKQPSFTPWHELAVQLRETGRFDLALEVADHGATQSLKQVAACYKILQARNRAGAANAEQSP
jgi:hypothetical protein